MNCIHLFRKLFGKALRKHSIVFLCTALAVVSCSPKIRSQSQSLDNPASSGNILSSYQAIDGTGSIITGSMTNRGALDAAASFPGSGYYSGSVNNTPASTAITPGSTILGVSGAATVAQVAPAQLSRLTTSSNTLISSVHSAGTCSTTTYTTRQTCETAGGTWTPSDLPAGTYEIPTVISSNWTTATAVSRGAFIDCGTSGTIEARISNCATNNGANATWPTTTSLYFPWGTWKLVSRNGANQEVWRDEATLYLWSSRVGTSYTWCQYTGNQENSGGSDCSANTTSVCVENGVLTAAVAGENFGTGTYSAAKGGMGRNAATPVRWRAFSYGEYVEAYMRGLSYVLPTATQTWTSTLWAGDQTQAVWMAAGYYGNPLSRTVSTAQALCIGR